jgi:hypothetical protein
MRIRVLFFLKKILSEWTICIRTIGTSSIGCVAKRVSSKGKIFKTMCKCWNADRLKTNNLWAGLPSSIVLGCCSLFYQKLAAGPWAVGQYMICKSMRRQSQNDSCCLLVICMWINQSSWYDRAVLRPKVWHTDGRRTIHTYIHTYTIQFPERPYHESNNTVVTVSAGTYVLRTHLSQGDENVLTGTYFIMCTHLLRERRRTYRAS